MVGSYIYFSTVIDGFALCLMLIEYFVLSCIYSEAKNETELRDTTIRIVIISILFVIYAFRLYVDYLCFGILIV